MHHKESTVGYAKLSEPHLCRTFTAHLPQLFFMDGKHPTTRRKRLECQSNSVLTNAVHEYMAANGHETEGKAVEALVRESLVSRGHLPAPRTA